jgi:urea transport system ATP-binding protein
MLAINNLNVYYGQSQIINDVTVKVAQGQAVCLMGRNGVGKTTLLRTIIGSLNSRGGRIVYEDNDLTQQAAHRRARIGIGYVPQGRGIFPYLTVFENLLIGFEAAPKMTAAEQQEAIEDVYELFPMVKQMRSRMAGSLSGGQQQQLAIARTLVRRPALVLLDEPTEGIQPSIVEEIERVIHELKVQRGIAVLLIEQFLDFALSVADYCYVMEKGRIVSEGAASDLNEDVIREHLSV